MEVIILIWLIVIYYMIKHNKEEKEVHKMYENYSRDELENLLEENNQDLLEIWKDTCEHFNYSQDVQTNINDIVYNMYDFEDMMDDMGWSFSIIATAMKYGSFDLHDDFAWFDEYGNFESSDDLDEAPIDIDLIMEYLEVINETRLLRSLD